MRKTALLLTALLLNCGLIHNTVAAERQALMVVGTVSIPELNLSDSMIKERLEAAGFEVTVVEAPASVPSDANGKALLVISSTVASGDVGTKFRNSNVPAINWEQAVQDDFGMTGNTDGTHRGTIADQMDLEIINSSHPLAAGLSGVVTFSNFPEPFSWGLPEDSAIKIAQIVDDPTKFPLYAYEAGAVMFGGFVAPARRVMLPMGDFTFENLTEQGLSLFDAAIEWTALSVSEIPTATISITSPAEGATLPGDSNFTVTVNAADPGGPIQRVEFYADDLRIGESTTAPFSFTWTNPPTGQFALTARVVDFNDRVVISEPVNVVVGTPPPVALLVVGTVSSPTLNAADAAIQRRLEQMGILVRVVQAPQSATADAVGKRLIIVSSTINSGDVAAKFRDVEVPVINWEQAVQDDFMMTGNTDGLDRGTQGGLTELEIVDDTHPLAAGLSGVVTVVTNAATFSWGYPAGEAAFVAQVPGDPFRFPIYAYDTGAAMLDGFVAPARRTMFFLGDPTYVDLTDEGRLLFDAAIKWTANITNDLPPLVSTATVSITSPASGATFPENGNIPLTVTATDPNGAILRVEYFAEGNKIGESTTSPFSFTWTNVASGRYTVSARALDRLGLTVESQPVSLVVGTPRPEILMVVGTVSSPTLNAADEAIRARLDAAGYDVRVVQAPASTTADANNRVLVIVSSTINSGDVAAKFRNVTVPVINWEQAVQDDFGMTGNTDGVDRGTTGGLTDLEIVEPNHPLAAGLSGIVTVANDFETFSWGLPVDSAIRIAQIPDDPSRFPIYAYDTGALMFNDFPAPARRVMLFMGDPTFANLTDDGIKLFDAAVEWALDAGTGEEPVFNTPTLQQEGIIVSWTGTGTLEQADQVTGPWTTAPDQANPQTVPTTGPARFYRIRQ